MFIFLFSTFFLLFIETSTVLSGNETTAIDSYLGKIFEYAKGHDIQRLKNIKGEVDKLNNSTLLTAYYLALYIADPKENESLYVDKFPTDHNGIMNDLYENIELEQRTPKFLYSMETIGEISLKGNEKAIEKVLIGSVHSDGVVSELFCDYVTKLLENNFEKTLTVLSRLQITERKGIYDCLKLMTSEELSLLKSKITKIKSNDQRIRQVIQEINQSSE